MACTIFARAGPPTCGDFSFGTKVDGLHSTEDTICCLGIYVTHRVPKTFIYIYTFIMNDKYYRYIKTRTTDLTHRRRKGPPENYCRECVLFADRRRISFPSLNDTTTAMMACNYVFENMHALCSRVRPSIRYGTREIFFSVSLLTGPMCTHNIIVSLLKNVVGIFLLCSVILYVCVQYSIHGFER